MSSSPPEVDNVDVYSSPSEVNNADVYSSPSEISSLQGISKPKSHKTTIIVTTSIIIIILIAIIIVLYFEGVFKKSSPETDPPNNDPPNHDPMDFTDLMNNNYHISIRYQNADRSQCDNSSHDTSWYGIDGRKLICYIQKGDSDIKVRFEMDAAFEDSTVYDIKVDQWFLTKIEDKICLAVSFDDNTLYLSSQGDDPTYKSPDGDVLVMTDKKNVAYDVRPTLLKQNEILVSSGDETSLQAVFCFQFSQTWTPGTGKPLNVPPDTTDCSPKQVILTKVQF